MADFIMAKNAYKFPTYLNVQIGHTTHAFNTIHTKTWARQGSPDPSPLDVSLLQTPLTLNIDDQSLQRNWYSNGGSTMALQIKEYSYFHE